MTFDHECGVCAALYSLIVRPLLRVCVCVHTNRITNQERNHTVPTKKSLFRSMNRTRKKLVKKKLNKKTKRKLLAG